MRQKQIVIISWYTLSYQPTLVLIFTILIPPLSLWLVLWKPLWKHFVTGRHYKWALPQSSIVFIKVGCDEPALLGLNHRPGPSLINTHRKLTPHCCCFPATEGYVNALVAVTQKCGILLISGVYVSAFHLHTCMFLHSISMCKCCLVYGPVLTWVSWCSFRLICVYACSVRACVCDFAERDH